MKRLLTALGVLACVAVQAANPSFGDFDANQFSVTGNKVRIKAQAQLTNTVFVDKIIVGGNGQTFIRTTNSNGQLSGIFEVSSNVIALVENSVANQSAAYVTPEGLFFNGNLVLTNAPQGIIITNNGNAVYLSNSNIVVGAFDVGIGASGATGLKLDGIDGRNSGFISLAIMGTATGNRSATIGGRATGATSMAFGTGTTNAQNNSTVLGYGRSQVQVDSGGRVIWTNIGFWEVRSPYTGHPMISANTNSTQIHYGDSLSLAVDVSQNSGKVSIFDTNLNRVVTVASNTAYINKIITTNIVDTDVAQISDLLDAAGIESIDSFDRWLVGPDAAVNLDWSQTNLVSVPNLTVRTNVNIGGSFSRTNFFDFNALTRDNYSYTLINTNSTIVSLLVPFSSINPSGTTNNGCFVGGVVGCHTNTSDETNTYIVALNDGNIAYGTATDGGQIVADGIGNMVVGSATDGGRLLAVNAGNVVFGNVGTGGLIKAGFNGGGALVCGSASSGWRQGMILAGSANVTIGYTEDGGILDNEGIGSAILARANTGGITNNGNGSFISAFADNNGNIINTGEGSWVGGYANPDNGGDVVNNGAHSMVFANGGYTNNDNEVIAFGSVTNEFKYDMGNGSLKISGIFTATNGIRTAEGDIFYPHTQGTNLVFTTTP